MHITQQDKDWLHDLRGAYRGWCSHFDKENYFSGPAGKLILNRHPVIFYMKLMRQYRQLCIKLFEAMVR